MDTSPERRFIRQGRRGGPDHFDLSRRQFLGLGAASVAAIAAGAFVLPGGTTRAVGPAETLAEPEVRRSQGGLLETTLEARTSTVAVGGRTVTTSVYEGSFPGPTLRVRPGDHLKIKLVNSLDAHTNLHTHGFHVSPSGNSDNIFLDIMPGESFEYEYHLPADHPPGLYWYHPHFHGTETEQEFSGMAGAIIIEGDLDDLPGIAGVPERLLALQATEFDPQGEVTPPDQRQRADFLRLVNGQLNPTLSIRPGETQRWRIANASATMFFQLQLDGHQLHQIASDGNTLGEVWTRDNIVMGPGERVEVLIQGGAPGSYALRTLAFNVGSTTAPEAVLATLVSEGAAETPRRLLTALIPFEDLSKAPVDNKREITFQVLPNKVFQIDGKQFDPNRIDQTVQLGATEEWVVHNDSDVWHPFHIHVNPYQVVAINGQPVPVHGFEDTTPVPAHGSITMRTRFRDFSGKFVYHCHILPHADGGMIGVIEVVDQNAAGPATTERPAHAGHHPR